MDIDDVILKLHWK